MHQPTSLVVSIMRPFLVPRYWINQHSTSSLGRNPKVVALIDNHFPNGALFQWWKCHLLLCYATLHSGNLGFDKAEETFLWLEIIEWRWLGWFGQGICLWSYSCTLNYNLIRYRLCHWLTWAKGSRWSEIVICLMFFCAMLHPLFASIQFNVVHRPINEQRMGSAAR